MSRKFQYYTKYEYQFALMSNTIHPIVWLYKPGYLSNFIKTGFVDTAYNLFYTNFYESFLYDNSCKGGK